MQSVKEVIWSKDKYRFVYVAIALLGTSTTHSATCSRVLSNPTHLTKPVHSAVLPCCCAAVLPCLTQRTPRAWLAPCPPGVTFSSQKSGYSVSCTACAHGTASSPKHRLCVRARRTGPCSHRRAAWQPYLAAAAGCLGGRRSTVSDAGCWGAKTRYLYHKQDSHGGEGGRQGSRGEPPGSSSATVHLCHMGLHQMPPLATRVRL